jgi:hypothetical protein
MDWRGYLARLPKLAVVAGSTVVGALVSPAGALVGLAAGILLDREVRGGRLLPSPREWLSAHGPLAGKIIPSKVIHPLAALVQHRFTRPGVQPALAPDEYAFGQQFGFTADELQGDQLIGMSVRGFADQLRFGEGKDLHSYSAGAGILPPNSGNASIPSIDSPLTQAETSFAQRVVGLTPAELGADRRKSLFVRGFADQLLAHYGSGVTLDHFGVGAGQTNGGRNDPPTGGKDKGGFNIDLSHVDWGTVAQAIAPALALIPGVGVVAAGAIEAGVTAAKEGARVAKATGIVR